MNNFLPQKRGMQVVWIIVGCLIYAVGLNVFIIPMNLYSGGAVGLAQLLSYGAGQIGIKEIAGLNLYGIIYLLLNIPILFIAWFKIGKTFFINTILGTVGISLFTSIVPTPATAVIADPVIGIIIGGVVTGAGIGIMLTAKEAVWNRGYRYLDGEKICGNVRWKTGNHLQSDTVCHLSFSF